MKNKKTSQTNKTGITDFVFNHPYVFILLLALIVYGQSLFFDYIHFDDDYFLFNADSKIEKLTNVKTAISKPYMQSSYYRPVVNLSFLIDAQIGGEKPFMHHFTNLVLHCLSSCLIFTLFRRMKYDKTISFFAAAVFAVHPILTNSVAWIAGRNDLLAGMFSLLAFIYFLKYLENNKITSLILQFLFLFLAIFSKEVALMAPFVMLVYRFMVYKKDKFDKNDIALLISWGIPLTSWALAKYLMDIVILGGYFSISNFIVNLQSIPETIGKMIIPANLSVLPAFNSFDTVLGFIAIVLVIAFYAWARKEIDNKKFIFGVLWFGLFFLPGLMVVIENAQGIFDYLDCRNYLPLIGLLIFMAELILSKKIDLNRNRGFIAGSGIVLILTIIAIFQAMNYSDRNVFRDTARAENPDILPLFVDLDPIEVEKMIEDGTKKADAGDYKGAIEVFDKVIKLDSNNYRYYANRGLYKLKLRDLKGALEDFDRVIVLEPDYSPSIFQRAHIKIELADYKGAILDLDKVIEIEPDNFLAYYQRGLVKYYGELFESGLVDCEKSIELKNDFHGSYLLRGILKHMLGKEAEGCDDLFKAREMGNPDASQFIVDWCNRPGGNPINKIPPRQN